MRRATSSCWRRAREMLWKQAGGVLQPEAVRQNHVFFFILENNTREKSNQSLFQRAGEKQGRSEKVSEVEG